MKIRVKKFRDNARLPMQMSANANGFDLFLPDPVTIPPSIAIPMEEVQNWYKEGHRDTIKWTDDMESQRELVMDNGEPLGLFVNVGRVRIPTGIGLELPEGVDCSTRGRSGCAFGKQNSVFHFGGVDTFLGTIDMDYRGEINLLLFNFTPFPIALSEGERIGQLVFTRIETPKLLWSDELSETERGEMGFGSTDRKTN